MAIRLPKCRLCRDLGWLLDTGSHDQRQLYFIECPEPECRESGKPTQLHVGKRLVQALDERKDELVADLRAPAPVGP